MAPDVLRVVDPEEIPELLKIFEKDWPKFYPLKQYVKIMEEFRYGDVENGVYLVQSKFPLITFDRFVPVINEVARTKGVVLGNKAMNMTWHPDPLDCSTLPEDVYLERLKERHANEVNRNWPHRFLGSEVYIGQQIRNNYCLGLFRKSDNKLACSALTYHSGGIFVLYTDPQFRGMGYADIIVRNMTCEMHKKGRIPLCTILLDNIPSQKLGGKLGYKHFTKVYTMEKLQSE